MPWLLYLDFIFTRAILGLKIQQSVWLILKNSWLPYSSLLTVRCPEVTTVHSPACCVFCFLPWCQMHALSPFLLPQSSRVRWSPDLEGQRGALFPAPKLFHTSLLSCTSLQSQGLDPFRPRSVFNPILPLLRSHHLLGLWGRGFKESLCCHPRRMDIKCAFHRPSLPGRPSLCL